MPPVPPPSKGPAESGPEGGGEGIALLLRFDTLAGGVSKHLLGGLVDVVGLGSDGGDGLHDRAPSSLLKARATFALGNFEQKLIYISQIDIRVKTCYTITDEKNSGDHLISRNVRWRVRQFDDVESAKRRPC